MNRDATTVLTPETTVNEAIRQLPDAVRVFADAGIDACCGGNLPIAEAARRHGLDPASVLADLDRVAQASGAPAVVRTTAGP